MDNRILIDASPLKNSMTGAYMHCYSLLHSLIALNNNLDISILITKNFSHDFGGIYHKRLITKLDKFYLPFKNRYSLIHSTFQRTKLFPSHYSGVSIITVHDLNFLYESISPSEKSFIFGKVGKMVKRSDKIIAISNYVKNDIMRTYNIDADKIQVIKHGCTISNDIDPLSPKGYGGYPFYFTIGAVEPKKNYKVLIASLIGNDYHLVIAGPITNENYKNEIIDLARRYNVLSRLHIVGRISESEKYWYYENCIALLFPSLAEGFGLPVLEAMHFGKNVVLSNSTSLPEIGGDEAYYFESFDAEYIRDLLKDLQPQFHDKEKSLKLRQWSDSFSYENAAIEHLKLYNEMLSK